MAKLIFTERFINDALAIWSPKVKKHLRSVLSTIEAFPESGSALLPQAIQHEFGQNVRIYAVNPYDVVYEYDAASKSCYVYALIPSKTLY